MLILARRWTLPAEKAWSYGDRCLTSTRTPRRPSHERQYLPDPRRTQHPPRPLPLPLRRTRTPPPGPHPAAAGRWLPLGHHRRRPLLLHPDHRPLEEALREEPPRRPARPTARPPAAPRRPLGCPGRPLGHRDDSPGLRLVAQPLVLRGRGPAAVAHPSARRQPRNRPPLAAPRRHRLAPAPTGPEAP